ncbi:biofilm formation regulator BssR, partial [Escherichia coli]
HHDCPTVITVNADKLENCLMSLTLSTDESPNDFYQNH